MRLGLRVRVGFRIQNYQNVKVLTKTQRLDPTVYVPPPPPPPTAPRAKRRVAWAGKGKEDWSQNPGVFFFWMCYESRVGRRVIGCLTVRVCEQASMYVVTHSLALSLGSYGQRERVKIRLSLNSDVASRHDGLSSGMSIPPRLWQKRDKLLGVTVTAAVTEVLKRRPSRRKD
jgi:hypothetical protein